MDNFLNAMLEDNPCRECGIEKRCSGKCIKYETWFRVTWHELQNLFLGRK